MIDISVVIPVLDDAAALSRCLDALRPGLCAPIDVEILVADGAACERTKAICADFGATYLQAPRGRGTQMNRAAGRCSGTWLWFLHADCVPPPGALAAIVELGRDPSVVWGAFELRYDHPARSVRLIEAGADLRARHASLPYGDNGIFVRRSAFAECGGYAELPILEDVLLSRTLRRLARPRILPTKLLTSSRRYAQLGVLRTTLINWYVMALYFLGSRDFERFARIYHAPRPSRSSQPR